MTYPTKKLGEIIEINYGKNLPKSQRIDSGKYFAYGSNGPVYNTDDSLTDGETIVIGRKGTAGALYFTSDPCWPIDTTFFAKSKNDTSLKFIYYLLRTKRLPKLAIVTGVPGINRTTLSNINVQLLPLHIQQQIVERLDKIAEAQKLNNRLIQKTDELFQSLLHKELNPAGKNWEIKKLGDVADFINGRAFKPKDWGKKGLPIIRIQNLNNKEANFNYYEGKIDGKNLVHNGDLLFSWSGNIGTSFGAFVWGGGDAILNQHIFKIKIKNTSLDKDYFYFFINKIIKEIEGKTHGITGLVHITKGTLEKVKILIPSQKTQKQIVAKLSAVQDYKKQLLGQKAKLKELFDSSLAKSMQPK
jgi:restriction endonuclease S subunit